MFAVVVLLAPSGGWRTSSMSGTQLALGPAASSTVTLRPDDEIVVVG
jgi:hypothetical protein